MARPIKQGLTYFPFDVDFFNDEKIEAISGEFGIKGEIVAIKLLTAVYRNGYFIEWSEMLQMKMLKSLPSISKELLDQIISRLIKWEFFDEDLFNSEQVLTSRGIQKRYFEAMKRNRVREDLPYLLVSVAKTQVSATKTPQNVTKTTQKKVNESKVKEDSVCIGSPHGDTPQKSFKSLTKDEFYNSLKPFVSQYGKEMVRDFFDYWTEPNGKGTPKFQLEKTWDTARRLSTWQKNEEKFNKSAIGRQPTNNDPPKRKRNEL